MKNIFKKFMIFAMVVALFGNVSIATAASLSDLQKQKDAAAKQAAEAQKLANQKAAEAAAIQQQISSIDQQINETEAALASTYSKITVAEANIADLSRKITEQEDEMAKEQDKMGKVLAGWYMEGDNSGLFNAIINSDSLSEVITKEEYYNAIRQQIELSMEKINKIAADLKGKKDEQSNIKAELVKTQQEQESYKSLALSRKSQKDGLLVATASQKKSYLEQVEKLQSEVNKISDAIYSERQRLAKSSNEQYINGSSGYPYSAIDALDNWGFFTRECTSYAAWYWNVRLGRTWERGDGPSGTGDAANWPNLAARNGVGVHSTPVVGAIISWSRTSSMPYGHVAIVESVNANGTIDLSEYNWVKYAYSYRSNVNPDYYGANSYIY